jgi:hypothetical protein
MTAIAAIIDGDKIWMGGDSAGVCTSSLSLVVRKDPKVFVKGKFIMGFTSSFRMGNLLQYSFKIPEHPLTMTDEAYMNTVFVDAVRSCFKKGGYSSTDSGQETGGQFIVGHNKKIYIIGSDFQVGIPVDNYSACGCGSDLCLGSLYSTIGMPPNKRIRMALQAAERFSGGVRRPFTIKSI